MHLVIVNIQKQRINLSIIQLFYLDNQLIQILNQSHKNMNTTIDIQSISTVLIQLGEQLTSALVCENDSFNSKSLILF